MKILSTDTEQLVQFDGPLEIEAVFVSLAERGKRAGRGSDQRSLWQLGYKLGETLIGDYEDREAIVYTCVGTDAELAISSLRWYVLWVPSEDGVMGPVLQQTAESLFAQSADILDQVE